jgi:hypothetical protein
MNLKDLAMCKKDQVSIRRFAVLAVLASSAPPQTPPQEHHE